MKTTIPVVLATIASLCLAVCLLAGPGAPSKGTAGKASQGTAGGGSSGSAGKPSSVVTAGNASIGTAGYPSKGSAWGRTVAGAGAGGPTDGRPVQFNIYCGPNNTVPMSVHWVGAATYVMGMDHTIAANASFREVETPVSYLSPVPPCERQHAVTISNGYRIGVYEVTHEQWNAVMNDTEANNPAIYKDPTRKYVDGSYLARPQENITQAQALEFCSRLQKLNAGVVDVCRLPTEAEWELAERNARDNLWAKPPMTNYAGFFGTQLYTTVTDAATTNFCWWDGDQFTGAIRVGGTTATDAVPGTEWVTSLNAGKAGLSSFSLFHMNGNVMEWCMDWFDQDYGIDFGQEKDITHANLSDPNTYTPHVDPTGPTNPVTAPASPSYGAGKVCRGGAFRDLYYPTLGGFPVDFTVDGVAVWPSAYVPPNWGVTLMTGAKTAMAAGYRFCWPIPPEDAPPFVSTLHALSASGDPSKGGWSPDSDMRFRCGVIGFRVFVHVLPLK